MLWMKKNAYEDSTTKATAKRLRHLERNCNLDIPENVKTYIANKQVSNAFKESLIESYAIYMKSIGKVWEQPFYQRSDKLPKIPQEEKIDQLIAKATARMCLFLSMMKDMGTRPVELTWLKIGDINLQSGTVNIIGAKHTVGRIGKLKPQTLEMLKQYITKKNLNMNDRLFPITSQNIADLYRKFRNALSEKLQDPTIRQIRLYDFRHFKATMEYHRTQDLLHVKALLGHKDLRTTLRYTQLMESLNRDEYHAKTASNIAEATQLIENGFEYVTEMDGLKIFRKRK
jgi:integrase